MKIVFYSPYLPKHFGGGEKYLFDTALVYAQKHQVFIALPVTAAKTDLAQAKKAYQDFLGRDLSSLKFIISPLGGRGRQLQKIFWTGKFDVVYYVTDGSAFFSLARRNIMHIQIPLPIAKRKFWEKAKFNCFKIINTNSHFTKKIVERYWGIKVKLVCQPGVEIESLQPKPAQKREKIILNVGRFFDTLHCKNQDILVEFFKNLRQKQPELLKGWKLVLIGKVESKAYYHKVKKLAEGLPVQILTNVSRSELINYYQKSAIYWHATGYFDDEIKHPEKMEHFGISTVEAMAAGLAPIVIAKGGQKEILGKSLTDCGWLTQSGCERKTLRLIKNNQLLGAVSNLAQKRASKYSLKEFEKKVQSMLTMKF